MPKMRLTTMGVERLIPPPKGQVDYFDSLLPGFGLRASSKGAKTYFVMVRVGGNLARVTIGRSNRTALDDARMKAREAMELADAGKDPRVVWRAGIAASEEAEMAKAAADSKLLFPAVAADFLQNYPRRRKLAEGTLAAYRRALQGNAVSGWGSKLVTDITRADVRQIINAKIEAGQTTGADRWLDYASVFFKWCAEQELIENAPTDRIRKQFAVVVGERVLSEAEIKEVWAAVDKVGWPFSVLVRLLILTGQRRNEVAGMRWTELRDLDTAAAVWELPGSRTKNKKTNLIPLEGIALDIVRGLPKIGKGVCCVTTSGATPFSGFSKAKLRLDRVINEARVEAGLPPMPEWTLHDLRRSFVTHAHEVLGAPPHVVEAAVNHASGAAKAGVAGVYNKAAYLEGKRALMAGWANHVKALVESGK